MKIVRASVLLLNLFIIISLSAQETKGTEEKQVKTFNAKRTIYLLKKSPPKTLRISEKGNVNAIVQVNEMQKEINGTISRIRNDSIFITDSGFVFHDFLEIHFSDLLFHKNDETYCKRDSANWIIIIPEESVFQSKNRYVNFLTSIKKQQRVNKFNWLTPDFHHQMLKFNFSLLANLEIAISYEYRFSEKFSIEIEPGYQFSAKEGFGFSYNIYPFYCYDGVSVVFGTKFYNNLRGYWQPVFIYKYLVMEGKTVIWPQTGKDADPVLQDQMMNQYGVGIRFGRLFRMGKAILDGYFGFGFKYAFVHQLAYGYYNDYLEKTIWYHDDHTPDVHDIEKGLPVLNAGIKIGFGFN